MKKIKINNNSDGVDLKSKRGCFHRFPGRESPDASGSTARWVTRNHQDIPRTPTNRILVNRFYVYNSGKSSPPTCLLYTFLPLLIQFILGYELDYMWPRALPCFLLQLAYLSTSFYSELDCCHPSQMLLKLFFFISIILLMPKIYS